MTWVPPRTIIGPPAMGDKYLPRPQVEEAFWSALGNGEHILFVAPRRVGKTSIMKALAAESERGFLLVYEDIESCGTSAELYRRLWQLILKRIHLQRRLSEQVGQLLGRNRVKSISLDGGIEFEEDQVDHKALLLLLVQKLGEEKIHVVLLLDEFPDVITRVQRNEGPEAAIDILHTLREMRQSEQFRHFTLVLAGSVGLGHVVSRLDRPKLILDLRDIEVPPLSRSEGHTLMDMILNDATMQVPIDVREAILDAISLLLPYHIHLFIADLDAIVRASGSTSADPSMIERAFEAVISRTDRFSDWESRLARSLDEKDHAYCQALLTCCAHQTGYTTQQAHDLSARIPPETAYKALIDDVLIRQGYLLQVENRLAFRSPFLQRWWTKRHPDHELPR